MPGTEQDLDRLDQLICRLHPIEQLFHLMGKVGEDTAGAELARGCAEIGLVLTGRLRAYLEQSLRHKSQPTSDGQSEISTAGH